MKPEITQKVKLVHSLNAHQDVLAGQSSTTIPEHRSGLTKIASLFGNHRSRAAAVMLGLACSMGISSLLPTNYLDTVAVATESATAAIAAKVSDTATSNNHSDRYVDQIRNDLSAMRAEYDGRSHSDRRIAQAVSSPRAYPLSVANRTDSTNSMQFNGEASVQIDVAAPKTKTFKPVATAAPYYNPNDAEVEGGSDDGYPTNRPGETSIGFTWPAAGKLTSRFGRRWGRIHKGIDIAGPVGTPIIAAADGVVTVAGWSSGYGKLVELRHSDGTITRYGHNSQLSVSAGQIVRQGQQVAAMGSTGRSTGSHLHFEIHPSGGRAVNPIAYLPANS